MISGLIFCYTLYTIQCGTVKKITIYAMGLVFKLFGNVYETVSVSFILFFFKV